MRIKYCLILALTLLFILGCSVPDETTGKTPSNSYITPDQLTETVIGADLIVLGIITEKRYDVVNVVSGNTTGKFAYTLYTLSVEKVVKGDPSIKEAIIRAEGGYIGDGIYQGPTGRHFRVSDHVLVSLIREDTDVYTLFAAPYRENPFELWRIDDGVLWIQGSAMSRDPLELMMGHICKRLRVNKIPISLNEPCPEPADEPVSPPKQ